MLKKILLSLSLLALPVFAVPTTISDTLYFADGVTKYTGLIDIAWQAFTAGDSKQVPAGHFQLTIVAGIVNVALEPNDTASPSGTSYKITYALNSGLANPCYWVVPTSGSPVTIASIQTYAAPAVTTTIAASQIVGILVRSQGGTNNTAGAISQTFFGTSPPGSVSGNLPGDFFSDTTNHLIYVCNAPSGTVTPACTSVTTGGWTLTNSSGGSVTSVIIAGTAGQVTVTGTCTITTSGTCTLSLPAGLVLPGTINKLTLTAPATGSTITITDAKTLAVLNTLSFAGTDSTTITFPNPASVTTGNCIQWSKSSSILTLVDSGAACGSATLIPGTTVTSGAAGYYFNNSGLLGVTLTPTFTSITINGSTAAQLNFVANASPATPVANTWGWTANAAMTTSWYGNSPNGVPSANQIQLYPAPTSNVSTWSWLTLQIAGDCSSSAGSFTVTCKPTSGTPGASHTFSGSSDIFICTTTCTITVPVPVQNAQYCVANDDNVSTVITLSAIGSSARYERTARTSYGTAGTGTFISGGAVGDAICIVGRDSTHYLTFNFTGTWTSN